MVPTRDSKSPPSIRSHNPLCSDVSVGPEGIEPSTFGLKVRRTLLRPVSSCRVLRGGIRDSGQLDPTVCPLVSGCSLQCVCESVCMEPSAHKDSHMTASTHSEIPHWREQSREQVEVHRLGDDHRALTASIARPTAHAGGACFTRR